MNNDSYWFKVDCISSLLVGHDGCTMDGYSEGEHRREYVLKKKKEEGGINLLQL